MWGLSLAFRKIGWILPIASTPFDLPFGTICTCEERLLNLLVGEEFWICFIYYICATILAPTSRIDGCRNLWHTIHEDGFINDVNWGQFVINMLVEGIKWYKQSNSAWVHGCILFLQVLHFFYMCYLIIFELLTSIAPTNHCTYVYLHGATPLCHEIQDSFHPYSHYSALTVSIDK